MVASFAIIHCEVNVGDSPKVLKTNPIERACVKYFVGLQFNDI